MTMKNEENKSTNKRMNVDNMLITDTLDAFFILDKVRINRGISVGEISAKMGVKESMYYRYRSAYASQKKYKLSFDTLYRLIDALGYEIRCVDKNPEKVLIPARYEKSATGTGRILLARFLNQEFRGKNYCMFIRDVIGMDERYSVEVSLLVDRHSIIYSGSGLTAEGVVEKADEYKVDLD